MTKLFCDGCGSEIQEDEVEDVIDGLSVKIGRGDLQKGVSVGFDNPEKAGDYCKYCVLDAIYTLDDRPKSK